MINYFVNIIFLFIKSMHTRSPTNSLSHKEKNISYNFMGDDFIKDIIRNNINKLTINDLKKFADSKNIKYTDDEIIIIYDFIMYNYNELLNENIKVFESIRSKINPNLYKELLNLYIEYKKYLY